MNRQEIELAEALAGALDGPDEHVLGPTDAALVVRALRAAAAHARATAAAGWRFDVTPIADAAEKFLG